VRRALPVYKFRGAVLEALREPASLVEGETGSGKTTQVRTCNLRLETRNPQSDTRNLILERES
jgi:HrpA-like RNA helicase